MRSGEVTCALIFGMGPLGWLLPKGTAGDEDGKRGEGRVPVGWSAQQVPSGATHHQGTSRNNFASLEYKEKLINPYSDVKSDLRQK